MAEELAYGGGSWVRRWLPSWAEHAYWIIAPAVLDWGSYAGSVGHPQKGSG